MKVFRITDSEQGDAPVGAGIETRPKLLALSASVLMDRIYLHTDLLATLDVELDVTVWTQSAANPRYRNLWDSTPATVSPLPVVSPSPTFPDVFLRRINDFAWQHRIPSLSRESFTRLVRREQWHSWVLAAEALGWCVARTHANQAFERYAARVLRGRDRCPEARAWLEQHRPDAVLTTGPFQFNEPAIVGLAQARGIPAIALIPSWDNISTKHRLVFDYDAYLVWSKATREELWHFYPATRDKPVEIVGAPQFDVFFDPGFQISRQEFASLHGLDPDRPILLYAIGSPNFLQGEPEGARQFAERVRRGQLGDAQLIVRPHPLHDRGELQAIFRDFEGPIVVQRPAGDGSPLPRTQDRSQIVQWVNTLRHANVVINLSSTIAVEAALLDRPIVNLDFDPREGAPQGQLIEEINHRWNHFRPIAESGGLWLARTMDEVVDAVKSYLADPTQHQESRRWIAEHVAGPSDGHSGRRMGKTIRSLVHALTRRGARQA